MSYQENMIYVYDSVGRIVAYAGNQRLEDYSAHWLEQGLSCLEISGPPSHEQVQDKYIHNGQPTPRPASPIARSGLTLSNVPTGSTLFIDGTAYPVQDTVDLSFPLPGTYALRVECFPYLDWTDEVTV